MKKEQEWSEEIEDIIEEYKEAFPKDFYLWSEFGFWIEKLAELQKQARKDVFYEMEESMKLIKKKRYSDILPQLFRKNPLFGKDYTKKKPIFERVKLLKSN